MNPQPTTRTRPRGTRSTARSTHASGSAKEATTSSIVDGTSIQSRARTRSAKPPGSIVAVLLWLIFSLLFSIYVERSGSFNATYGAFAGIVILMLYIYYSAFIVLVGAQLNQVIEEHIPEGKDEGEKTLNTDQQPG